MSEHIQAKNNRVFFSERITFVIMTLHLLGAILKMLCDFWIRNLNMNFWKPEVMPQNVTLFLNKKNFPLLLWHWWKFRNKAYMQINVQYIVNLNIKQNLHIQRKYMYTNIFKIQMNLKKENFRELYFPVTNDLKRCVYCGFLIKRKKLIFA